jgi:hypothetical protein
MGTVSPREIARVSIEIACDDGTVMTFTADRPERAEIDVGSCLLPGFVPPGFVPPGSPFRIEPPPVLRASVSFEAHPRRPMIMEIRMPAAQSDGISGDRDFLVHLLRVVADKEELDPAEVEFAVVTAGRAEHGAITYWPWQKGEIVAVPVDGFRDLREGRSFAKYDIGEERFGRDWAAAERRSAEVRKAPDVDALSG